MSATRTIFIEAPADSPAPAMVVGGLTVLERRLCEAERAGYERAVVAVPGPLPRRAFTMQIDRVEPGGDAPAGADVVSADSVAGIVVRSRADVRRAEWAQLSSLPKSFQGPVDALINRHLSLRITRVLARTPITPNIVTAIALAIGIGASVLLGFGPAWSFIVAGVLMELQSIIDSCDGELARLRFQFSDFGQWLDNIADDITDSALMLGLGAAAASSTGESLWLWIGVGAAAARVFTQLVLYWQVTRVGGDFWNFRWWFESDVDSLDEIYDMTSPMTWFRSLGRRDVYLFLWGVLCVVGLVPIAAGYAAAMSALFTAMTVIHLLTDGGKTT